LIVEDGLCCLAQQPGGLNPPCSARGGGRGCENTEIQGRGQKEYEKVVPPLRESNVEKKTPLRVMINDYIYRLYISVARSIAKIQENRAFQRFCVGHFCPKKGVILDIFVLRGELKMLQVIRNVNEKTGEVLSQKEKYVPDAINEEGYRVPSHKAGAKLFADVQFPREMTDAEIGKMARLAKLMIADSNMLGYRTKGGIKAYTREQIIEVIGLSDRRGREFIGKMLRLKVMQVCTRKYGDAEQEEFYINPAYFFAGRRISLNLYLLFREALDPILPAWVRYAFWQMAQPEGGVNNGGKIG